MVRVFRPQAPAFGLWEIYGGIGLLAVLVARFVPLARWFPFWGCVIRRKTGIPCLTCGMTRSFDWFMQGRFLDSLSVNPLGFLLALLSAAGALYFLARPLRLPRLRIELTSRQAAGARIGAVLLLALNWGYLLARALLADA
jgi:hypothetical protein